MILDSCSKNEEEIENKKHKCKRFSAKKLEQTYALLIIKKTGAEYSQWTANILNCWEKFNKQCQNREWSCYWQLKLSSKGCLYVTC